jgi:hypothetical protein
MRVVLNRRTLLKYGTGGAILLAAGSLSLALQPTKMVEPLQELKCLSKQEYSILFSIADTILPENGPFPAASTFQIAHKVDAVLFRSHPGIQTEIKQLLALIENAAVATLFDGHIRPFTHAPAKTQFEILESWRTSRLSIRRTGFKAISGLCNGAYYALPESYSLVGYEGPPPHLLAAVHALREAEK